MKLITSILLLLFVLTEANAASEMRRRAILSKRQPPPAGGGGSFPSGFTAYWKMDEISGTRVDHFTGNDLAGDFLPSSRNGVINNGADFTPASFQFLTRADTADLSFGTDVDFSISIWFLADDLGVTRSLISKNADANGYDVSIVASKLRFTRWSGGGATPFESTASLSAAETYHVVITYDQSNIRIYINGSLDSTHANTLDVPDDSNVFTIGRDEAAGGNYWDGMVDEVGIAKGKALSGAEVTGLYNGGNGVQP